MANMPPNLIHKKAHRLYDKNKDNPFFSLLPLYHAACQELVAPSPYMDKY